MSNRRRSRIYSSSADQSCSSAGNILVLPILGSDAPASGEARAGGAGVAVITNRNGSAAGRQLLQL